jgi:8-oxo-dGTP diphosphatase
MRVRTDEIRPPEFGSREPGARYVLRPGAHALVIDGTRVATVKLPTALMFPGGGIEDGESAECAAIRETLEECGLRIAILDCLGVADELVFSRAERQHFRKRATFFRARVLGTGSACEEDHELRWTETADALSRLSFGSHRWALEQLLARTG